ncbi:MAG: heme exporter protein CcmB [Dehalococcoidales bacterium]|nr:heme exporter protein CcmB [Dehalococcoidales bacterium]
MNKAFTKIFTIFWKDMLTEFRTREIIISVLVFALLVLVIFSFAFGTGADMTEMTAPGILWVALTFGGIIGLTRTFAVEKENSRLEGLMLCPVDRAVIYWGKLAGSFTFMLAVAVVVTPIFLALFNLPIFLPRLALVIVLALIGFASVGTLFSALAVNTRARDIMLPILFLPVVVPVIVSAVKATVTVLAGAPWGDMLTWLQIMIAFDIIYLVAATLVFEFVVEE